MGLDGGDGGVRAVVSANSAQDPYPFPIATPPPLPALADPPPGVDIFLLGGLFICNPVSHDSPPPSALHSDCLS